MPKLPYPLLASFAVGAICGILLTRWFGLTHPNSASPGTLGGASQVAFAIQSPTSSVLSSAIAPTPAAAEADAQTWLKAWVSAGAPAEQREKALQMVALWADVDARNALEFVAKAARFPGRLDALVAPLAKLGESDVAFTINWMLTRLTIEERKAIGGIVVSRIGEKNPALGLDLAFTPNIAVGRETFARLIAQLVRTEPAQALAYFGRLSEEGRMQAAGELAGAWFATDREAVIQWCAAQRAAVHGQAALKGLIETVAKLDPDQLPAIINRLAVTPADFATWELRMREPDVALALLPHLTENGRQRAVSRVVGEELQRDPALALRLAREALAPEAGNEVIKDAWEMWRESDAKAARDWADGLSDPALKLALLGEPVDPLLEMDPQKYLVEADRSGPGSRNPDHIQRAISTVSETNPQVAAGWIDRMPQSVTTSIVRDVASDWLKRDERAAWRWITALPDVTMRDAALAGAIDHWRSREQLPQATTALAAISDARQQTVLRWEILRNMNFRDPAAARQWLQAQPISNEVRESWLTILETRP